MIRRYFYHVYWFLVVGGLVMISAFNAIVDPGWQFNITQIKGFNYFKDTEYSSIISRQHQIRFLRPSFLIFGSSRVAAGISTDHPIFTEFLQPNGFFKFNISSPNIKQIRTAMEFTVSIAPVKKLIIGLDFFMFNAYHDNGVFKEQSPPPLISINAVKDSLHTIEYQQKKSLRSEEPPEQLYEHFSIIERYYMSPGSEWFPRPYYQFDFVDHEQQYSTWNDFRSILEIARRNDIKVYFYISPIHARLCESLDAVGLYQQWENWKRNLVLILAQDKMANKHAEPFPLWDFSGYNSITTEMIPSKGSPKNMKYYRESSHFKVAVGDLVLNRIFNLNLVAGNIPEDFGSLLSADNIEAHLIRVRQDREKFRQDYSEDYAEIVQMAKKIKVNGRQWQK